MRVPLLHVVPCAEQGVCSLSQSDTSDQFTGSIVVLISRTEHVACSEGSARNALDVCSPRGARRWRSARRWGGVHWPLLGRRLPFGTIDGLLGRTLPVLEIRRCLLGVEACGHTLGEVRAGRKGEMSLERVQSTLGPERVVDDTRAGVDVGRRLGALCIVVRIFVESSLRRTRSGNGLSPWRGGGSTRLEEGNAAYVVTANPRSLD